MSHKDRSIANMRCEAKKIYHQRREINRLEARNKELEDKINHLKSKIENKDKWNQLIADIAYDYDGYNDVDNLKTLIDELVKYALYARDDYNYEEFLLESKNE